MREDPCIKSPVLYLQHQYELLQIEYEYEKEQFKQQTELMGIGRKIKREISFLNIVR
jgi:ATP-dependent RNA/DNA helicase IGHMBP2